MAKKIFDVPIKNKEETYEKNKNNDYTTNKLMDYDYFSKLYK